MNLYFSLRFGAVAFLALAVPPAALADPVLRYYGQFNLGVFSVDDGTSTETFFADNDNSNSRIGLWIENELANQASIKFNFETALGLFGSSAASVNNTDFDIDYNRRELRKFEIIYENARYGKFSAGQGSMAADGVAEADFSGTSVIAYSGIADLASGFQFRPRNSVPSDIAIGDVFKSFDGARRFRVRYDTPGFSGFVFGVAGGAEILNKNNNNEYYDISAKYSAEYDSFKVDARLGYAWVSGNSTELLVGSISGLHKPTGLSLSLSSGAQVQDGDDSYYYAKLGYQQDWFDLGTTALSLDYYDGKDHEIARSESKSAGVALVQNIDAYSVEVFAAYRTYSFDASGTDFEDIDALAIGARWKF